jgi:hypothetical protein
MAIAQMLQLQHKPGQRVLIKGYAQEHNHRTARLKSDRKEVVDHLRRIDEALAQLGDDPANIEKWEGTYEENPTP